MANRKKNVFPKIARIKDKREQKSHKTKERDRERERERERGDAKGGPSTQSRQKEQASWPEPTFAKPGPKLDIHERQERGMKSKKKEKRESKRR